jgi:hypothetical protein
MGDPGWALVLSYSSAGYPSLSELRGIRYREFLILGVPAIELIVFAAESQLVQSTSLEFAKGKIMLINNKG